MALGGSWLSVIHAVVCFLSAVSSHSQSSRMSTCWGSHILSWQPSNKQQYVFGLVGKGEGMTTMEDKGKDDSREG